MFAYVRYLYDLNLAMVPTTYILKFNPEKHVEGEEAGVFWNDQLRSLQDKENKECMEKLAGLKKPPKKHKRGFGERYYSAVILRVEDSLEALIESLDKRRVRIPTTQYNDASSAYTEEEGCEQFRGERLKKKGEEAILKGNRVAARTASEKEILEKAQIFRDDMFDSINGDSDADPEVIPDTDYKQLKSAYNCLEHKNEKLEKEVEELRILNRQLQERLLTLSVPSGDSSSASPSEEPNWTKTEMDLGQGIIIPTHIYNSLMELDHVRKFTKSLAVAIWGSEALALRSVTGKPCRNMLGPKKKMPEDAQSQATSSSSQPKQPPKPPLTPEKLSVVSEQMRVSEETRVLCSRNRKRTKKKK